MKRAGDVDAGTLWLCLAARLRTRSSPNLGAREALRRYCGEECDAGPKQASSAPLKTSNRRPLAWSLNTLVLRRHCTGEGADVDTRYWVLGRDTNPKCHVVYPCSKIMSVHVQGPLNTTFQSFPQDPSFLHTAVARHSCRSRAGTSSCRLQLTRLHSNYPVSLTVSQYMTEKPRTYSAHLCRLRVAYLPLTQAAKSADPRFRSVCCRDTSQEAETHKFLPQKGKSKTASRKDSCFGTISY